MFSDDLSSYRVRINNKYTSDFNRHVTYKDLSLSFNQLQINESDDKEFSFSYRHKILLSIQKF